MDAVTDDEGKDLKNVLPGETFLFAMQGFIQMGELLLEENPNSKAKYYDEAAKDMLLKFHQCLKLIQNMNVIQRKVLFIACICLEMKNVILQ